FPDSLPTLRSVKPPPDVSLLEVPPTVNSETLDIDVRVTDRGGGVGEVRTFVNGSAVSELPGRDLGVAAVAGASRRTIHVRLVSGSNDIQVIAFNADGSVHSNPAQASVVAHYGTAHKPQLYALVVGIDDFDNPALHLKYAVDDASAVAAILRKKAGPLFGGVHVEQLI